MQPTFEKVALGPEQSLCVLDSAPARFNAPWHFHEEHELTLVPESHGTRFVGDRVARFYEGDLVLVGSNLPHCWVNEPARSRRRVSVLVVQFKKTLLVGGLDDAPELNAVKRLLARASRGLEFRGRTRAKVAEEMLRLRGQSGAKRLISFLSILENLAESHDAIVLSSAGYKPHFDGVATERVDQVFRFLLENFRERIRLNDVARIAHLSPAAFCRHFRRATGRSLIQTVNDIRVGHACRLLVEGGSNASQACFASGFNNLSHYNRQFYRVTGLTPSEYKAKFSQAGG